MEKKPALALQARLGAMMFFQYMMFAVWWIPLAAYLANMELSRNLTALILSSMAFGSVVSPMVGMLADRYFKGQYVLAVSNTMVAIMLIFAGSTSNPIFLFVFLLIAMLFYMPTWALTSAIALKNVPGDIFPRIRVFGTVGWILAGVFSIISLGWLNTDFDGTRLPFYFGAGLSVLAAMVNLTLPDTPPQGKGLKSSWLDIMGFRSIVMLRNRNYAIFMVIFFLAMIPFSMYWSYFSEYLSSVGYKLITVTMSTGQILELFILLSVPFFIRRYGLRNTMIIGLAALVVRFAALYLAGDEANLVFVLIGAGMHGIIFGFYHMGAQIYTDKVAPDYLKSQAQGLLFFVTFAMGLLAGNFVCGWIISIFSSPGPEGIVYQWDAIWGITTIMSAIILFAYLLLFREKNVGEVSE
jgi:nucleoside transporter